jgi:ubiquinone/menaquinone biosynthesis C-methylase UbiE
MNSKTIYNYSTTDSIFKSWGLNKYRSKIHNIFLESFVFTKKTRIIDIGSTQLLDEYENILLKKYKYKNNITCFSNQNLINLKKKYKKIKILQGDGRKTNLKKNSYDIAYSSATIEHVGSFLNQVKFIKEMLRVAKKGIFVTTPNRYFPFDLHTFLPLIHILPKRIHRRILKFFGYKFLSQEKNLNLLGKSDLTKICEKLKVSRYEIKKIKVLLFTSNLLLIIKK